MGVFSSRVQKIRERKIAKKRFKKLKLKERQPVSEIPNGYKEESDNNQPEGIEEGNEQADGE